MNHSAVRSSARIVRLADLEPLHVTPASQAGPSPMDVPLSLVWPPPIGSEAA